ncbi:complex I subunit 5 family protein [Ancylobacter pratisalsi]|uniref:NADH/ubiquinone/plastoquinone (Complex I) n=1 Tax=Ancylobacter pratisalsi TaxID=1745854 RepID=A0A6P1YKK3_9HYPH|nr:complex I subunit 5 family protein [Ancylobacter pratisalsi]QIB33645.1 NADH/ubiquinone/plastoquinone (complex I) [Ancylobacter pratisalsi]
MSFAALLLAAALILPLLLAGLLAAGRLRTGALELLALAPLPALAAALLVPRGALVLSPPPLRIVLAVDTPGAVLLGGAALLWAFAGLYARHYMARDPHAARFAFWWLATLAGSLGTFVVADLASFYLMFSLASLSAFGLVAHERSAAAQRAGFIYMGLAILGEALLLLAFVMFANGGEGNPLIAETVARLSSSPLGGVTLALLIVGFGMKMGLVPLHVWMPLAHPVAPMPASAVLSGIIVKAGVIGLIRFLPLGSASAGQGLAGWGAFLTALGLVTAFYGVAIGITQRHPKTVLAYSTVSQMGFVAAILGAGLASGAAATASITAVYGLHHMLVKGTLFLGVGVAVSGRHRAVVSGVMGLLALSLAGLPFTSGALAKYAAKEIIDGGLASSLASLSAAGSTLLMLHFLQCLSTFGKAGAAPAKAPVPGLVLPWALTALISLALPWLLFGPVTGIPTDAVFSLAALWGALWPVLMGAGLAIALRRFACRLPRVPEGDLVVLAEAGAPLILRAGAALERGDAVLRQWPAGLSALVCVGLALAALLHWGR